MRAIEGRVDRCATHLALYSNYTRYKIRTAGLQCVCADSSSEAFHLRPLAQVIFSMQSDIEQAVKLMQSGREAAVEEVLALLQNTVFSFSMRVCGHREDAEDTAQEVLLKLLPYFARFDSPNALAVWLYKVAKNHCLMSRRKSKFAPKRNLSLEELMPERQEFEQLASKENADPEAFSIRSQEVETLRESIQKLPLPYRLILVLHDMEGLTDSEVGDITGLRSGTVRVRLHRARLFVRKGFADAQKQRTAGKPSKTVAHPTSSRCRAIFADLSDYLDQQLEDRLCQEIATHLEGCVPCKAFLSSLQQAIEQCRRAPKDCPDRGRAAQFRKQLLAMLRASRSNKPIRPMATRPSDR
jgi:RNA polymerase sigma-70 factor (ECF subfamily)